MDHDRRSAACDLSRRRWLKFVAVSLIPIATSAAARGDEKLTPEGRLFVYTSNRGPEHANLNGLGVIDLKSGTWSKITAEGNPSARVSPDERYIAYFRAQPQNLAKTGVWLLELGVEHEPKRIFEFVGRAYWASDSKKLLISRIPQSAIANSEFETWRIDLNGENGERLPLEKTDHVIDWAPDGRSMLVSSSRDPEFSAGAPQNWPVEVVNIDGTARRKVIDGYPPSARFSLPSTPRFMPDGRNVIYLRHDSKSETSILETVGADGEGRKILIAAAEREYPLSFAVADDSKQLAVVFMTYDLSDNGKPDRQTFGTQLATLDIGGGNRRLVPSPHTIVFLLDWRSATP